MKYKLIVMAVSVCLLEACFASPPPSILPISSPEPTSNPDTQGQLHNPPLVPSTQKSPQEPTLVILKPPTSEENTQPQASALPEPPQSTIRGNNRSSGASGGSGGGFAPPAATQPTPKPIPPPVVQTLQLPTGHSFGTGGLVLSDDGTVYLPSKEGLIVAYNNGNKLWEHHLGTEILTHPTLGPDGSLYVTGNNGSAYGLNPDGTLRWTFTPAEPNSFRLGGLALDENGILYTGGTSETVYAIQSTDGSEVWRFKARAPIDNAPVVSANRLYVLALDQTLYSLNRSDGQYVWEFQTGQPISNLVAAITHQEDIVFGSQDPWLYSVSRQGIENWSYTMSSALVGSPVIDIFQNTYVATSNGVVYSLDPQGNLNWQVNTGSPISVSPVIGSAGELYVANDAGKVMALGLSEGELVWEYTSSQPIRGKLLLDNSGHLFFSSGEQVKVLDTSSLGPEGDWPMQQKQIQGRGLFNT